MAVDRTKRFFYITMFIAVIVLLGGLVMYFGSERAIEAQREGGEGVLQEMTERRTDEGETGEEAPGEENAASGEAAPDEETMMEEREFGLTPDSTLLVEEWIWETTGDDTILQGAIRNLTGEEIGPIVVQFELQDGSGNSVGSAEEEVEVIRPQARWEFEIPVVNPGAVQAELREVIVRNSADDTP